MRQDGVSQEIEKEKNRSEEAKSKIEKDKF
jgi:hypothetical protein